MFRGVQDSYLDDPGGRIQQDVTIKSQSIRDQLVEALTAWVRITGLGYCPSRTSNFASPVAANLLLSGKRLHI